MKLISLLSATMLFLFTANTVMSSKQSVATIARNPSKNDIALNHLLDTIDKVRSKDVSESLRMISKAIGLADSLGEPLWKARFQCNQGVSYRQLKLYDAALKSQYDALAVFKQFRDSAYIATSMYEIGNIYAFLKDYEQALSYHFNALYLREYDDNKLLRAKSYLAIGDVLMQMQDNWRALDFFLNAKTILEKENDTAMLAAYMVRFGELMLQMERYNEALDHLDTAIAYSTNEADRADVMLLKAKLLYQINKPEQALTLLLEANKSFEESREFSKLITSHKLLRNIYLAKKSYEKAIYHADLVNDYGDSLKSVMRMEEIERLEIVYETRQREAANETLKFQLKEIRFQSRIKGYFISLLILGIFIAFGIRLLLRNRRTNQRLQLVNQMLEQKVEERTSELTQQSEDLREAYLALKKSEALFRAINETVPLGVAVTDIHGNINLHNQRLLALGFKEAELANLDWCKHIIPEEVDNIRSLWEESHQYRKPLPETLFRITLNNELKWLRMRGVCLELEGKFSGMVVIMEDFSDIKKNELDLIKAKNKAEESDKLKSAFLANMSHEIRTPMNAILGFADLLPSPEYTNEEKQEFITTIQSSGQLLLNLINDIIDISKIEAGELKIIPTTFDLGELMETLFQTFRQQLDNLDKQHVKLLLSNKEASLKYVIHTDKLRLQQILTNLLSNASKFTHEGQIEFGVISIGDQYEFYVKDTGIGIQESKLDVIFDRFRQADDSHTKQYGGTGLGLAISKHLTHLLGGKIWVESVEGKGTSFYFTLPGQKSNAESAYKYPDYSNKKVLVVEDVETNFHLINNMLRRSGIKVFHAQNGYIVLDIVQNEQPDLVLMDIQLPELDGLSALKILRKQHFNRPVVAITAFAMAGDAQYYLRQGFDSYLSKPLGTEKLYQLLHLFFDPEYSLTNENGNQSKDEQQV
ncbi:MAG TPA: ATP-binding protein [Bacteroidales bacterium]|nr:ATP-binding protein [Bacteroidales bacterium]